MVQLFIKLHWIGKNSSHPNVLVDLVADTSESLLFQQSPLLILRKTPGSTVPEMTIIELQGDLETRSQNSSLNGKFIGDLHFTKAEQPVLIVGHHILYGKVVRLEKPMAVVVKSSGGNADPVSLSQKSGDIFMDNSQTVSSPDQPAPSDNEVPVYHVTAVIRNKIIFKTRPRPIISNVPKHV